MRASRLLLPLCVAVAVLAGVAAAAGLLTGGGVGPFSFTSVHGDVVEMYGRGLYDHDTLLRGSGQRGVDLVTLFVALPLLAVSAWLSRRGSLPATLTLTGALAWFAYGGISYVAAVTYNELFFVYVALLGTSLLALVAAVGAVDRAELDVRLGDRPPRRGPATVLISCGVVTFVVWASSPLVGLLSGEPPGDLETYPTLFTHGFDMAVLVPATLVAGVLVLRRDPRGYALGVPLVVFAALLAPMITAMTVLQVRAGVDFNTAQVVGPIAGFLVLAMVAVWTLVRVLRHLASRRTDEDDDGRSRPLTGPATAPLVSHR